MVVQVESGPVWRSSPPAQALPARYYDGTGLMGRTFDISPNGHRFLMITERGRDQTGTSPQIVVVQNWTEELKASCRRSDVTRDRFTSRTK
jgi:hypothetical protein